ncbi:DUF4180 domain-containing protein [Geosporobacter subterraneus]|uniref:DUF4180 domain-containing protein n=1 Tax=Geosporobacter subterraneus TaxID=390806 RepID=UPI0038BBDEDC
MQQNCIRQKGIREEFFRLSIGIAGEVLQKFINYHTKLLIIGDFSKNISKPLHDLFIRLTKAMIFSL